MERPIPLLCSSSHQSKHQHSPRDAATTPTIRNHHHHQHDNDEALETRERDVLERAAQKRVSPRLSSSSSSRGRRQQQQALTNTNNELSSSSSHSKEKKERKGIMRLFGGVRAFSFFRLSVFVIEYLVCLLTQRLSLFRIVRSVLYTGPWKKAQTKASRGICQQCAR